MMAPLVSPTPLLQLAQSAMDAADFEAAQEHARVLFDDVTAEADDRREAGIMLLMCAFRRSDHAAMMRYLPQALALCEAVGSTACAFEVVRLGSMINSEAEHFGEALRWAREADARTEGDPARQILAAVAHALCFQGMGDPWQARRMLEPALAQARVLGVQSALLRVLMVLSGTLISMHHVLEAAGDHREAIQVIEQARAFALEAAPIAEALRDGWLSVAVQAFIAEAEFRLHRVDAAAEVVDKAMQHADVLGLKLVHWRLRCLLVEILLARQDVTQAFDIVKRMLDDLEEGDRWVWRQRVHHVAYLTYVAMGDGPNSLAQLELCVASERHRTAAQLRSQAQELVSRLEVENAVKQAERASGEAREYRRRADALADVALKDSLTGVLNRRGLDERLSALWCEPSVLVAAMVDFDFFKYVNDTYGHGVGDQVLARLGSMFREHLRPRDAVARYGGEEFVLLLAGLTLEEATEVCERLRVKVERLNWSDVAPGLCLTVSIGLAESKTAGQDGTVGEGGMSALLGRADVALYRAKSAGRNRVEVQR